MTQQQADGGDRFAPTYEEFFRATQQMYPEQAARIHAELRAAKMQNYIDSLAPAAADVDVESAEQPAG